MVALIDGDLLELGCDQFGYAFSMAGGHNLILFAWKDDSWNVNADLPVETYLEGTVLLAYFISQDVSKGLFNVSHRKVDE